VPEAPTAQASLSGIFWGWFSKGSGSFFWYLVLRLYCGFFESGTECWLFPSNKLKNAGNLATFVETLRINSKTIGGTKMEKRRLYRSESDRMIGGVCGGLGDYLDIDPTLVRIVFVALALMGGPGLLLYLILLLVVPSEVTAAPKNTTVVDAAPEDVDIPEA
jgi:phage shock protein C